MASALAVTALITLTSAALHAFAGNLEAGLALPFAAGALAGQAAGRHAARRVAGPRLQQSFALLCAGAALALAAGNLV